MHEVSPACPGLVAEDQGSFREDLDTDEVWQQYQWVQDAYAGKAQDPFQPDDGYVPPAPAVDPRTPRRVGNGPAECSTSVAVVPTYPPTVCWDVNGWYRTLGANHRMSRSQLGKVYRDNGGDTDARKTFIFTSLLDTEVKREYDLTALGDLYLNDPLVQEWLAEQVLRAAKTRGVAPETILDEMGLLARDNIDLVFKDSPMSLLDGEPLIGNDCSISGEWTYSYWTWLIGDDHVGLLDQAEEWQTLLVSACARKGLVTRLRVGLMDSPHTHRVQMVEGNPVVFGDAYSYLNDDIADLAVDELIQFL